MSKKENHIVQLNAFLQSLPSHFQVLETPVDVDVQMAYYTQSRRYRESGQALRKDQLTGLREVLLAGSTALEQKKHILVQLASVDLPESYRIIEQYAAQPDKGLEAWSTMALRESKMALESSLLDENQVYISTGLGGKGEMLRYFAVMLHKQGTLAAFQKKVLAGEIRDAVKDAGGETERIVHFDAFSTVQLLVPVHNDITHTLMQAIQESNAFGGFLETDLLVTNMKLLDEAEIRQLIAQRRG